VPENRILRYNQESLKYQQEVKQQIEGGELERKRKERKTELLLKKKSKEKNAEHSEGIYSREFEVVLDLPDSMKLMLVDEWENVTKNGKVFYPDEASFSSFKYSC
jgi:mortality factor 4-like protein 1